MLTNENAWFYDQEIDKKKMDRSEIEEKLKEQGNFDINQYFSVMRFLMFLSHSHYAKHDKIIFLETGIYFIDSLNEFADLFVDYSQFFKGIKQKELNNFFNVLQPYLEQ